MNQLSLIVLVSFLHFSGMTIAQTACDYDGQSFEITTQAIYDVLLESKNDYDSIHLMLEGSLFIVVLDKNSTTKDWLTNDYNYVSAHRRKSRIKSISTDCLNAKFKYSVFGKLKTIRFNYPMDTVLYEGTIFKLKFVYEDGKLTDLLEDGNWGSNIDYSVVYFD